MVDIAFYSYFGFMGAAEVVSRNMILFNQVCQTQFAEIIARVLGVFELLGK